MALIGDRERERAAALLRAHYVRGRLSVEELSDRLGLALAARRDRDVRLALAELPSARIGLDALWRSARRAAFLAAVWTLWWAASLVLLIGWVAAIVVQGLSLVNAIAFPLAWVACTFTARRVARRTRA
jgi:hypothetical protein